MCGRYTVRYSDQTTLPDELAAVITEFIPRYNIAPQQTAPVIRLNEAGTPVFEELCWGFRPSWMKDKNKPQINARAETVFEKPMFKHSALKRRCLVLAIGWYEWQQTGSGKQPFLFHRRDDALFAFAGIWTRWHDDSGHDEDSYAILTTAASTQTAPIHNRMPVVLSTNASNLWLRESDSSSLNTILTARADDVLDVYPISTRINNTRNDDASCLERLSG